MARNLVVLVYPLCQVYYCMSWKTKEKEKSRNLNIYTLSGSLFLKTAINNYRCRQAGVELGLTQAETVSLELGLIGLRLDVIAGMYILQVGPFFSPTGPDQG